MNIANIDKIIVSLVIVLHITIDDDVYGSFYMGSDYIITYFSVVW